MPCFQRGTSVSVGDHLRAGLLGPTGRGAYTGMPKLAAANRAAGLILVPLLGRIVSDWDAANPKCQMPKHMYLIYIYTCTY